MIPRNVLRAVGLVALVALVVVTVTTLVGRAAPRPGRPVIVAGVTQWAALARQLVGSQATVVSLLSDPNADPHSHEATPADALHVAQASVVIENGAGYDTWLAKLVQAGAPHATMLSVASLMHIGVGSNPHIFYDVTAAERLVVALRDVLTRANGYPRLAARARELLAQLAATQRSVAQLRASCADVRVAATEDVTGYLLADLGLRVVTPERLRLAIGNSVDPTVHDLALALRQLRHHPAFLVNNVQTATPLTNEMVAQARAAHVPVINVTETMSGGPYAVWIDGVLKQMRSALRRQGCAT